MECSVTILCIEFLNIINSSDCRMSVMIFCKAQMIFGKTQQTVMIMLKPNNTLNMRYLHLISKGVLICLNSVEVIDFKFSYLIAPLI